jgi:hypothetical protein
MGGRSAVPRALWGFERCACFCGWAIFHARRPRMPAQLGRYGMDIAKWGFELSRRM